MFEQSEWETSNLHSSFAVGSKDSSSNAFLAYVAQHYIIQPENSTDARFEFQCIFLSLIYLGNISTANPSSFAFPAPSPSPFQLVEIFPARNVIRFTSTVRRAVDIFFLPSSSKVRMLPYNVLRSLSRFFFPLGNTAPANVTQYFHCALCSRLRKWISSLCRY